MSITFHVLEAVDRADPRPLLGRNDPVAGVVRPARPAAHFSNEGAYSVFRMLGMAEESSGILPSEELDYVITRCLRALNSARIRGSELVPAAEARDAAAVQGGGNIVRQRKGARLVNCGSDDHECRARLRAFLDVVVAARRAGSAVTWR
jgi:hypothetical protein